MHFSQSLAFWNPLGVLNQWRILKGKEIASLAHWAELIFVPLISTSWFSVIESQVLMWIGWLDLMCVFTYIIHLNRKLILRILRLLHFYVNQRNWVAPEFTENDWLIICNLVLLKTERKGNDRWNRTFCSLSHHSWGSDWCAVGQWSIPVSGPNHTSCTVMWIIWLFTDDS